MKIQESKIKEYSGTTFDVVKTDGVSRLSFKNGDWIENKEHYGKVFLGDCEGCLKINELYKDFTFDKILILGLGLGLLPNYAEHVKNCSVVDVVENNQELIDYVDYLDENIDIIKHDAFTYKPSKKYDLVLVDLWWGHENITEDIISSLDNNYKSYLEDNGKILIPVLQ
tara:strand:+ start:10490 stop:10996 length:507 start_codon:yes stop_codon:yes gene_type:complete